MCGGPSGLVDSRGWPHGDAVVDYHATEGRSWRVRLGADGVRTAEPVDGDPGVPSVSGRASAAELVLTFYGRVPVGTLTIDGEARLLDLVKEWDPEA